MVESITFTTSADRKTKYSELLPQIESLVKNESDLIANLANIAAVLKEAFDFFWVGFYLYKENSLVLGPFQGPVACTRIELNKGVCGQAFSSRSTIVVPDVDAFPGHIACSSLSRSEIVIPMFDQNGNGIGVLDIDSDITEDFSEEDAEWLRSIVDLISSKN